MLLCLTQCSIPARYGVGDACAQCIRVRGFVLVGVFGVDVLWIELVGDAIQQSIDTAVVRAHVDVDRGNGVAVCVVVVNKPVCTSLVEARLFKTVVGASRRCDRNACFEQVAKLFEHVVVVGVAGIEKVEWCSHGGGSFLGHGGGDMVNDLRSQASAVALHSAQVFLCLHRE